MRSAVSAARLCPFAMSSIAITRLEFMPFSFLDEFRVPLSLRTPRPVLVQGSTYLSLC